MAIPTDEIRAAMNRLEMWADDSAANWTLGWSPDLARDLRLVLTEFRELKGEADRLVKNYESLDSILRRVRASIMREG